MGVEARRGVGGVRGVAGGDGGAEAGGGEGRGGEWVGVVWVCGGADGGEGWAGEGWEGVGDGGGECAGVVDGDGGEGDGGKGGVVVGTCSEASDELVRRVGADEVSLTWATGWWGWRGLIDGRLLTTRSILRRPTTSYSTTTRGPSMRSSTSPAMITSYTIDPCPI